MCLEFDVCFDISICFRCTIGKHVPYSFANRLSPHFLQAVGPPDARSNHSLKDFFANLVACVVFTQPEERIFEFTHQDGWMHPSIENTNQA